MRTKPVYLFRIGDDSPTGSFLVYKFSNYSRYPIQLVKAGVAFHKGNYSNELKRAAKKYDLDLDLPYGHNHSCSYDDFLSRVYVDCATDKYNAVKHNLKIPSTTFDIVKRHMLAQEAKKERKREHEKNGGWAGLKLNDEVKDNLKSVLERLKK